MWFFIKWYAVFVLIMCVLAFILYKMLIGLIRLIEKITGKEL